MFDAATLTGGRIPVASRHTEGPMANASPSTPDYRRLSKTLCKLIRAGDANAWKRARAVFHDLPTEPDATRMPLRRCQHVIAREAGAHAWKPLMKQVADSSVNVAGSREPLEGKDARLEDGVRVALMEWDPQRKCYVHPDGITDIAEAIPLYQGKSGKGKSVFALSAMMSELVSTRYMNTPIIQNRRRS